MTVFYMAFIVKKNASRNTSEFFISLEARVTFYFERALWGFGGA